jgi:hypothetical protein
MASSRTRERLLLKQRLLLKRRLLLKQRLLLKRRLLLKQRLLADFKTKAANLAASGRLTSVCAERPLSFAKPHVALRSGTAMSRAAAAAAASAAGARMLFHKAPKR